MQNELDSAYGSFQEEAQKLFGELSQSDKAAEAPSVEKLLDADRRLRAGLVELTKHQKLARQYLDIQSEVSAAEARLREVARRIVDSQAALATEISRAEKILEKGSLPQKIEPVELVRYATLVAPATGAPPEWRTWRPLLADGRVLQPYPLPHEVMLPPRAPGEPPGRIPSMVHASWLREKRPETEPVGPSAGQAPTLPPATALASDERGGKKKRGREEADAADPPRMAKAPKPTLSEPKPPPAEAKKPASRVVAGFSDDEDDDDD